MPTYPSYTDRVQGFRQGVDDIPSLKALTCYEDKDIVLVKSREQLFYFNSSSTATPDDVDVVKPDNITLPNPGRWIITSGTGGGSTKNRFGQELMGSYNGINREFSLPEVVLHSPPNIAVCLFHNGRRLRYDEFEVYESIPSVSGLDMVRILTFRPQPKSKLFADYVAA